MNPMDGVANLGSQEDDQKSTYDIHQLMSEISSKGVTIPHEKQQFNWDCGIACLRMVLKYFEKNQNGELMKYFTEMGLRTSIWTVDLAYLLTHFQIENQLSTVTLGVDANYAGVDFYASHLNRDNTRVSQLFRDAHVNGVKVVLESVTMDTILDFLEEKRMIIILIDWKKMGCLHCSSRLGRLSNSLDKLKVYGVDFDGEKDNNRDYQGHYICLTGVDREKNLIYFANPSAQYPVCVSGVEDLERARKSYGTDEDIIFVYGDCTVSSQGAR